MNILITESQDYSTKALAMWRGAGRVKLGDYSRRELLSVIGAYEVLVIRLAHRIDREMISAAIKLKYIVTPTTGVDHIDTAEAEGRGIHVISLRGEQAFLDSIPSTAEHTFALLLSLLRNVPAACDHVKNGGWDRQLFRGHNLHGIKLGILGMGRVGNQVAGYARAFGMEILTYDPDSRYLRDWMQALPGPEELFAQSQILTIHIPLNDPNRQFVSAGLIGRLPKGAYMVNTSRGDVWDEAAVAQAVASGSLAGVATDVLSREGEDDIREKSPLLQLAREGHNVLITPHIAGATYESMHRTEEFVAGKYLQAVLATIKNR